MGLEEIKTAIKALSVEDRRKVAVYILELERDHVQTTIGPQIAKDLEAFSKIVQDSVEKLKKIVNKT
ncbi:MAG TPA: hypothetical protein VK569_08475 [Bacteroidota bacterium]|nr:hypothetical protein [Bacteroidota bacterium]